MNELIEILTQSTVAVVAAGGAFVLAATTIWFFVMSTDRRTLCMGYVFLAFLFEVFMHEQPYLQLGLNIYPNDLVSVLLILCVVLGSFTRPLPVKEGAFLAWLALGAAIFASLGIGLGRYGAAAGTEVRDYFYYWAVGLFCLTADFDEADMRRLARWALWTAYGLIAIALYRWIGVAVGVVPASILREVGITSDFRALPSIAALYLAAAALVLTMAWLRGTGSRAAGPHALVFTAFVIVLQHRSVWIAYGIALAYVLVQERRMLPRRFPWIFGFVIMASVAIGVAALYGHLDELFEALWASTVSVFDSRTSVTGRIFGWEALVEDWADAPMGTLLMGFPFGHGWRRVVEGRVLEFSPHNFYVDMLLRVGLVGLAILLLANLMATVHSLRVTVESEIEYLLVRGMGVTLLASLVYYVPYSATYLHGAITGLALAQISRLRDKRERPQPAASPPWTTYKGTHAP